MTHGDLYDDILDLPFVRRTTGNKETQNRPLAWSIGCHENYVGRCIWRKE